MPIGSFLSATFDSKVKTNIQQANFPRKKVASWMTNHCHQQKATSLGQLKSAVLTAIPQVFVTKRHLLPQVPTLKILIVKLKAKKDHRLLGLTLTAPMLTGQ